jgi:hypothetical protein
VLFDVSLQLRILLCLNEDSERMFWLDVGIEVTFFNSHDPARARRDHSEAEGLVCYNIAYNHFPKELTIY